MEAVFLVTEYLTEERMQATQENPSMRLLVVGERPTDFEYLRELLESAAEEQLLMHYASSPQKALDCLRQGSFDLLLRISCGKWRRAGIFSIRCMRYGQLRL